MPAVDDEADYAVLAKEEQATRTGSNEPQLKANLPEGGKRQARDDAARDRNVSARSAQDAKAVISKGSESEADPLNTRTTENFLFYLDTKQL
ncbi:MAG: hypothetical protein HQK57_08160 [Deltaproteobacteria bacterium]|nr:hypothetical protein [Deltaproteobacteria bacterium]